MSKQPVATDDKALLAEQAYRKAYEYENDFGCCPQCVLTAVKETVGIPLSQRAEAFIHYRIVK